jgi:type IV pilus assembly protein PilO
MHKDFTIQKRIILIVLAVLVAADLGLAFYSWQLSSSPYTRQEEFDSQNMQLKVLKGDIKSAQDIKDNMPATRKDCEKFEHSLPRENIGYSAITAELDAIAKKAGLQIDTRAFKQKDIPERGLAELNIDATVTGDYGSVARFVNGLQRSQSFYVVDGLALATDMQKQAANGPIRVALHVRTYFREAA